MACEVPGNASRGSEKRTAAPGGFPVAEAKVQATSSLPLHVMAGLGSRPEPPTFSGSVSWNLAGHWWEPSGAHRGCARPQQDSTFSEKWCCKNGVGASQATGESFFKQNFGSLLIKKKGGW